MATNIAETSVTVPGVRFVIDPGYVKQKTYDPARRMESLVVVPISQVASQQRAGRAGRTAAGQCYRLYTRDCYAAMLSETVPEVLRTNLANTLLYLKVGRCCSSCRCVFRCRFWVCHSLCEDVSLLGLRFVCDFGVCSDFPPRVALL